MTDVTDIVVLSHGTLAKGLVEAASMIAGKSENLHYVCLEEGQGPDSFREKVNLVVHGLTGKDVVFLIDLFGGTPSNTASMFYLEQMTAPTVPETPKKTIGLMTGVNLGILLEAMSNQQSMGAEELVSHLVSVFPTTVVNLAQVLKDELNKRSP